MIDLDTRARDACEALRTAVAPLAPAESVTAARRTPPMLLVAGAVTCVVLAAIAIAIAALATRGDDGTDVVAGPGAPLRLVARDLPEDLEPTGATNLPLQDANPGAASIYVYGIDSSDLFAGDEFSILVAHGQSDPLLAVGEARSADIEGMNRVTYRAAERVVVNAQSYTLDGERLEQAARAMVVDGDEVRAPSVVGGLRLLGALPRSWLGSFPIPVPDGTPGWMVGYQADTDLASRSVAIVALDASDSYVAVLRWAAGPEARGVRVRGHDAFLGGTSDTESLVLAWRENGNTIVAVSASGLTPEETLRVAEALAPATDDEWNELLELVHADDSDDAGVSGPPTTFEEHAVRVLAATNPQPLTDGRTYRATLLESEVCLDVTEAEGSGTGYCFPIEDAPFAYGVVTSDGVLVFGLSAPFAEAQPPPRQETIATIDRRDERLFVFVEPEGTTEVVFRDADGTEVGRAPVQPAD